MVQKEHSYCFKKGLPDALEIRPQPIRYDGRRKKSCRATVSRWADVFVSKVILLHMQIAASLN
ncbi:hypothetical protein KIN20_006699 [Parelaphostrongylus tenuis]|uniref:Uncharacterized protein n=1 Tax=Parelaphostrongylus tenuis TaxID=148309 RepID=A0AAD5M5A5_PARTN|nr:hypothetical protein KIN20_006699 [Parelaphostrongylus tenuis]